MNATRLVTFCRRPQTAPDCSKLSPTLSRVATSSYQTKNSFNENRRFSYRSPGPLALTTERLTESELVL